MASPHHVQPTPTDPTLRYRLGGIAFAFAGTFGLVAATVPLSAACT
jgi:hypothetical protein